jgi:hypothetical protein
MCCLQTSVKCGGGRRLFTNKSVAVDDWELALGLPQPEIGVPRSFQLPVPDGSQQKGAAIDFVITATWGTRTVEVRHRLSPCPACVL